MLIDRHSFSFDPDRARCKATWFALPAVLLVVLLGLPFSLGAQRPAPNAQLADGRLNRRVEELLSKMSLEEKVGQLTQYSAGAPTGPGTGREDYMRMAEQGEIGSLLNVVGAAKSNVLQHAAVEKSRLHIPLLFGLDVIHGYRTVYPVPLGLAASFDPALVEQVSHMAGKEAASAGTRWVFSPMVDIARDARWGRIVESAGEDPYLGSAIARAYIRGYQGDDLARPDAVAASVKHFAAYGAAIAGRDYNAVDMSDRTLRQVYLPPYHAAVDADAATVMSAFNTIGGIPATANPFLLTEVLRKEWGFQGFVVTDWQAILETLAHGTALDGSDAARQALLAGADMDMESDLYKPHLAALVRSGKVPPSVVDEAVRRVLRVKLAMGLFEHPYTDEAGEVKSVSEENRALARKAAEESFVLLKNSGADGGAPLLPLAAGKRRLALIGPLADSRADMLGSWAGAGQPDDAVTLKAALEQRAPHNGTEVVYAKGTEIGGDSEAGFAAAVEAAKQADVAVLALGEQADTMTGEASSRAHLDLPGNQQKLLEAVVATGKPVVLLVFSGRPLVLNWAAEHVPAIVEVWFPGVAAGPALADVLFGDASPSGRLPVSFPRAVGQEPLYYAQLPTGRPAKNVDLSRPPQNGEEKYLSRYIDVENAALYPFGFGLTYTRFSYSKPVVSQATVPLASLQKGGSGAHAVNVIVTVTNAGQKAGTEVTQLYVRNLGASVSQPVRDLKGFERVTLQPGESRKVTFQLGFDELALYNAANQQVVEPTRYTVFAGGDSTATENAEFSVAP